MQGEDGIICAGVVELKAALPVLVKTLFPGVVHVREQRESSGGLTRL